MTWEWPKNVWICILTFVLILPHLMTCMLDFQDFSCPEAVFIHHGSLAWIFWMICQHLAESHSLYQTVSSVFWSYLCAHSLYFCLAAAQASNEAAFPPLRCRSVIPQTAARAFERSQSDCAGHNGFLSEKHSQSGVETCAGKSHLLQPPAPFFAGSHVRHFGQGHVCSLRWMPSLYF